MIELDGVYVEATVRAKATDQGLMSIEKMQCFLITAYAELMRYKHVWIRPHSHAITPTPRFVSYS